MAFDSKSLQEYVEAEIILNVNVVAGRLNSSYETSQTLEGHKQDFEFREISNSKIAAEGKCVI